jgi:hypothetical protein
MRTPHVNTDEKGSSLWHNYLRARRQHEIVWEASSRFCRLEDDLPIPDAELPQSLRLLLGRGQDLLADFESLRATSDAEWNSAAWAYAGYVVDLNYGDQVEVSSSAGKVIFHCCHLQMDDASDGSDPADLCISGPVARKDGSPGKRSNGWAKLFSDEWKLVGRARPEWIDQLREFWP